MTVFGFPLTEWFLFYVFIWLTHYSIAYTQYLFDRRRKMLEKAMAEADRAQARKHVDELIDKHDKLNPEVVENYQSKGVLN